MSWQKDLSIKPTDSPQDIKKKLNVYFFLILGFLAVTGLWPFLIIAVIMYQPIIKKIEQELRKNSTSQTPKPKVPIDKHRDPEMKNIVKVDTSRSVIAIVGFIIFVIVVVVYYYVKFNY